MATASSRDRHPCFIVSTGRCGSRMLAKVLDLHPTLAAYHEPRPRMLREAYLRWSNQRGGTYVHKTLRAKRDESIKEVEEKGLVYVESSHFLSHLIPELEERYEPLFVHLFRNGRDFTRSGLERGWYEQKGTLNGIKRWLRRHTGLRVGDKWEDHRLSPPKALTGRFERIVWLWREINREILRHLEDVPDSRCTEVRLEKFDRTVLEGLLRFLGVPVENAPMEDMMKLAARKPNQTEDPELVAPDRWPEERRARFDELAGPMMKRLGYEPH